jgi:hypothetical protein
MVGELGDLSSALGDGGKESFGWIIGGFKSNRVKGFVAEVDHPGRLVIDPFDSDDEFDIRSGIHVYLE